MAKNGMNRVTIVGNIGDSPELRSTKSGISVTNMSIATSEKWQDKETNEFKQRTDWHRVVMYSNLAEIACKHLRKGSKVYVEGHLRTREWKTKQGVTQNITEILVDQMQMLDKSPVYRNEYSQDRNQNTHNSNETDKQREHFINQSCANQ